MIVEVIFMLFLGFIIQYTTIRVYWVIRFKYKTSRYITDYILLLILLMVVSLMLYIPAFGYFQKGDYMEKTAIIAGIILSTIFNLISKKSKKINP